MSSIDEYYGGAVMAMKGKDCIAIATDRRFGNGFQTQTTNAPKVEQISKYALMALTPFAPDCQMIHKIMKSEANMYQLEEGREISAQQLTKLVSYSLYEKRQTGGYLVSPMIAGFDNQGNPYTASMDGLGATTDGDDWVVDGTAHDYLLGPAQYYYKKDMSKEELLKVVTTVMQAATNRDALSGWGIDVYLMDKNGVTIHHQPCRMD